MTERLWGTENSLYKKIQQRKKTTNIPCKYRCKHPCLKCLSITFKNTSKRYDTSDNSLEKDLFGYRSTLVKKHLAQNTATLLGWWRAVPTLPWQHKPLQLHQTFPKRLWGLLPASSPPWAAEPSISYGNFLFWLPHQQFEVTFVMKHVLFVLL